MLPTLNYDAILSDPLLLVAGVFLIAGPLVFLVSLIKLISSGRKQKQAAEFDDINPFSPFPPMPEPQEPPTMPPPPPYMTEAEPEPVPSPVSKASSESQPEQQQAETPMDKTMIMPAGTGEIQGQLEIAFSQIKTLGKKVSQMESELDSVARNVVGRLDKNELKEVPMNPGDFTQKLLKLAEHVIVLEKEVERLKMQSKKETGTLETNVENTNSDAVSKASNKFPTAPSGAKPPMMPL